MVTNASRIRELYRQGLNFSQIAARLSVSRQYVARVVGTPARGSYERLYGKMLDIERRLVTLTSEFRRGDS
jgi:hypothetical protein